MQLIKIVETSSWNLHNLVTLRTRPRIWCHRNVQFLGSVSLRSVTSGLRRLSPLACAVDPRGYFRSECCTGGESLAAPRVNFILAPAHQRRARGWTGRKHRFSSLRYDAPGFEPGLPALMARAQPTRPGMGNQFARGALAEGRVLVGDCL